MLFDPERKWHPQGICNKPWHIKYFFAPGGPNNRPPGKATQAKWDQAKKTCARCPVRAQCARDTLGEPYGVWGGRDQWERFRIRQALAHAVRRWPRERQLAWGRELTRWRDLDKTWKAIQQMTGIPESPGIYLVSEWEKHLAALKEQESKVVDLPLPEPEGREKTPFPERPGKRHAWVRRHASNLVADGYYKGQTADGAWIYLQLSGRASSYMWARAEDVQIYQPQPVVILEYRMRPDALSA